MLKSDQEINFIKNYQFLHFNPYFEDRVLHKDYFWEACGVGERERARLAEKTNNGTYQIMAS